MKSNAELWAQLDRLVNGRCERRALRPLSMLLPVYPMVSLLSDSWHDLRAALRSIRSLREPDLSASEEIAVSDALRAVEDALTGAGQL